MHENEISEKIIGAAIALRTVRKLITDLAERRKPSGVAKPEGLRPAATFRSGSLFPDTF